jgi:hypothetical protein
MVAFDNIKHEFDAVVLYYPHLNVITQSTNGFLISGTISIIDSTEYNWGEYEVDIFVPITYPSDLPRLIEKGGAIERHIDWHISKSGVCCVGTDARQFRDMRDGISLLKWIKLFVIPYLANHMYKKEKGEYVDGELSHGPEGIFQDYAMYFNLQEPLGVISRLNYLLGFRKLSLNTLCFCESGKKYKRCYLINPIAHQLGIPSKVLEMDLRILRSHYSIH